MGVRLQLAEEKDKGQPGEAWGGAEVEGQREASGGARAGRGGTTALGIWAVETQTLVLYQVPPNLTLRTCHRVPQEAKHRAGSLSGRGASQDPGRGVVGRGGHPARPELRAFAGRH